MPPFMSELAESDNDSTGDMPVLDLNGASTGKTLPMLKNPSESELRLAEALPGEDLPVFPTGKEQYSGDERIVPLEVKVDGVVEDLEGDPSIPQNGDNDDSTSGLKSATKRHRKLNKRMKKMMETEQRLIRRDGITYVQDDHWLAECGNARNCHLFVGLMTVGKPDLENEASPQGGEVRPSGHLFASKDAAFSSSVQDRGSAKEGMAGQLPCRIRIMNELLLTEMSMICGYGLNNDHVAPFRTLVLFEQQFRQHLARKEQEFLEISRLFPRHRAVLRQNAHLPDALAYGLRCGDDSKPFNDEDVERARIILDGFRALVRFLDTDLKDLIASVRGLQRGRVESEAPSLPFSHLWYLFNPGQEVLSLNPKPQVYRVLQVVGGRMSLEPTSKARSEGRSNRTVSDLLVDCFSLDFDGREFAPKPHTIRIQPYDDALPITKLPIFPLVFADPGMENRLIKRGQKFEELVVASHRKYKGLSLKEGDRFDVLEEIDSDVIVDFYVGYQNSEAKIPIPLFGGGVIQKPTTEDYEETHHAGVYFDDEQMIKSRWSKFINNTDLIHNKPPGTLTRDSYILLPGRVYGYVLLDRKWLPLDIDLIEKVPKVKPGENDGFQKLVLPDGHKDIIRALVNTHARELGDGQAKVASSRREFDVVRGKGKGLIILLHGAPGVGKTSTAECVAANAGRPLLPITCGDLGGNSAREVEQNLDTFFDLARKWGCVLLLDEADVFLTARDKGDIRQSSLVSVFLRVLEYYSGILILTTNRVGSFDEAIKSRVHCALYYPPLNKAQSLRIWRMNLDMLEDRNDSPDSRLRVRFDREELENYARKHWKSTREGTRWNGRQIKNAFQTAVALADWDHFQETGGNLHPDGPLLKRAHFDTVAQASAHFDHYLIKVRSDQTDQDRAKASETRRDDIRSEVERGSVKKQTRNTGSSKYKHKSKAKPPSPESSDESTDDDSSAEEESSSGGSETESEEEPEVPPPPPQAEKKSGKRKSRKD